MYKITSLLFSIFFAITPVISMEREYDLKALPLDVSTIIIARCEAKNALRQTCERFSEFASRRKNENILLQPQLYLTQEALDRYLLYYGALGNTAIVRNLLERGANLNAREDNGITLMHHAMRYGYDDIVKMLSGHPDLIKRDTFSPNPFSSLQFDQSSFDRMCPLCVLKPEKLIFNAIEKGSYAAVEYFLSLNVSANVVNKKGENALYCAAQAGYLNIMKLLISKGANINGRSFYNKQGHYESFVPLQVASQKGHTSAVQLLIDYNVAVRIQNERSLASALDCGYVQIVKMLLAQEAEFSDKDWLVYDAAYKGHIQIVKILLEDGVTINKRRPYHNNRGKYYSDVTPLDVADSQEVRNLLRKHGGKTRAELENCIVQ